MRKFFGFYGFAKSYFSYTCIKNILEYVQIAQSEAKSMILNIERRSIK